MSPVTSLSISDLTDMMPVSPAIWNRPSGVEPVKQRGKKQNISYKLAQCKQNVAV